MSPGAQPGQASKPLELTPSLRSVALAALARCAPHDGLESKEPGLAFLARLPHVSDEQALAALRGNRRAAEDAALHALGSALALEPVELLAIALLLAADDEPLVAYAIAALQAPAHGGRPTLGLLAAACAGSSGSPAAPRSRTA